MDPAQDDRLVGRFEVEREVGRGAVGIVYRAFDVESRRPVALKIIAESGVDPAERTRFIREGQILNDLHHPGIVQVVAFGELDAPWVDPIRRRFEAESPYVAMEWLDGEDLTARQKRAPVSLRQAVDVGRQVAAALAAAHEAGVVHRDIKPSNIFLVGSGLESTPPVSGSVAHGGAKVPSLGDTIRTKLVDFGVAANDDVRLTKTGAVVGTPAYMAPEQARGDPSAGFRSDLYSLGATLFELIAGRPPHIGPTSIATLARLVTTAAPRLSEIMLDVPPELDELIDRMLRSDPAERPGSAREIAERLESIYADPSLPESARPAIRADSSHGSVGTRLVTTLVALHVATGEARSRELQKLNDHGADALPLGTDSIVAHLGARRAYGDEATRALELGEQLAASGARVGVATGRTRVDLDRSSGEIVDRAAALARGAQPGRLIADPTTTELARGRFEFDVPASSAEGGAALRRRTEVTTAPFVGREAELVSALSAYDRCVDDITPLVVSVSGPPGIGKSRLGRELVARINERPDSHPMTLVRCEPYGRAQALGVAASALRGLLALPKGTSETETREALGKALGEQPEELDLLTRLILNEPFPDDVEPRAARDALYVAMTNLVVGASARAPTALVIEDAQWADPESIAWIDHLLGRANGRALFVLLLMRPAFWREQPQRFSGRDHVRIELRPIARRATREIARAVIGHDASEEVLNRVAEQAAGSPLFAEELARLIAAGRDTQNAATIEAAIQVSLDALDDATREAVVRMSVFGLSVWDLGLASLGVQSPEATLKKLMNAELLVEQRGSRFATARELSFKHGLVRDVAYASAGDDLKKELHAAAARWLASMGEDAATVAQHFDLGGRHEQAAEHWEKAARRALATNSLTDAVTMADRALAFAESREVAFARASLLEEAYSRLDPRSGERGSALMAMRENTFDEASELRTAGAWVRYDHARGAGGDIESRLIAIRERATSLGLVEESARCSATLATRYAFAGQFQRAEQEASQLLEFADKQSLEWAAVDAWQTLAVVRQTRGELAAALDARRSAAKAARAAGLQEREAMLLMNLGFALTTIGARQEALHELESGLAKAGAIGSLGAVRHGRMNLLGWAATFGADQRLEAELAEPRASADEAASGMWVTQDRVTLGVLFYRGCELLRSDRELARARTLLKLAANAYRETQNRDVLPVALGFWAEAERRFGNAEQAIEIAREAAELLDGGAPSLLNEAPIYLALHDACVDVGDLKGARDAMERGIPPLLRRLRGLEGTDYPRSFLLGLTHNSGLLVAAEAYGCVPEEIERILVTRGST